MHLCGLVHSKSAAGSTQSTAYGVLKARVDAHAPSTPAIALERTRTQPRAAWTQERLPTLGLDFVLITSRSISGEFRHGLRGVVARCRCEVTASLRSHRCDTPVQVRPVKSKQHAHVHGGRVDSGTGSTLGLGLFQADCVLFLVIFGTHFGASMRGDCESAITPLRHTCASTPRSSRSNTHTAMA